MRSFCNSPVGIQVQMSRGSFDFTQIAIPKRSHNVFVFILSLSLLSTIWFIRLLVFFLFRNGIALKCLWVDQNERQNISLHCYRQFTSKMVKMKIINLHIKCKKLVIQKCGTFTRTAVAVRTFSDSLFEYLECCAFQREHFSFAFVCVLSADFHDNGHWNHFNWNLLKSINHKNS